MSELSDEKKSEEIKKCAKDPIYFIETYGLVETKNGTEPFKLFSFQINYINALMKNKYIIVDKPRQMGFSLVTGAFLLWKCCFNPNKKAAVVSTTDRDALVFLSRAKFLYDNMPKWLVGNLTKESEHEIEFDNDSSIRSIPGSKKSGALRGYTINYAILDEFAFAPFPESLLKSSIPALQVLGENLIILSTPNGTEGSGAIYYRLLQESKERQNDFFYFETNWYENPLYNTNAPNYSDWQQNEWAMAQCKRMGEVSFRAEILKEFILSGETVLPQRTLEELFARQPIRFDFIRDVDYTPEDAEKFPSIGWDSEFTYAKGFWVWKDPEPGHYYILGADISSGRADDYSTVEVIDLNTMEQVAEYRSRIPTSFFFDIIYNIAKYYNEAFIAIETNSDESVINKLVEVGYDNIYYRIKGHGSMYPGWNTNIKSRGLLVSHLQDMMINRKMKVSSQRLISELKTFVWEGGKAQASKKCNDDLVFGFMIGTFVIEEYLSQQSIGINIKDGGIEDKELKNSLIPFSTSQDLNLNESTKIYDKAEKAYRDNENKLNVEDNFEIDKTHYEFIGYNKDGTKS